MNYKKILTICFLVAFFIPNLATAKSEKLGYCNGISNMFSKIDQRMNNRNNGIEKNRGDVSDKIEQKREEQEQKKEEKREKWDINRENHFSSILEKAGTKEQKETVSEIIQNIRTAVQNKRVALDSVIDDFHKAVDDLKNERNQNVNTMVNVYGNETKLAFSLAEEECVNKIDPGTVRENLRNRLRNAKSNFNNNKPVINNMKEELAEIINTKKEAIKNVLDNFRAEIKEILNRLESTLE